jgi:hypothetical protein
MSTLVPLRAFNRSQKFDIGAKSVSPSSTVYVNVDSPRVQRDLARHAAIGALLQVGPSFFQADDGYVTGGGKVSSRATTLVLDVSPVAWVNAAKVAGVQSTAGTATLGAADATNPRIDVVVVDTTTGAFSVIAGTATAGASLSPTRPGAASTYLAGVPAISANKIALAYVLLPPTATTVLAANVLDVRP